MEVFYREEAFAGQTPYFDVDLVGPNYTFYSVAVALEPAVEIASPLQPGSIQVISGYIAAASSSQRITIVPPIGVQEDDFILIFKTGVSADFLAWYSIPSNVQLVNYGQLSVGSGLYGDNLEVEGLFFTSWFRNITSAAASYTRHAAVLCVRGVSKTDPVNAISLIADELSNYDTACPILTTDADGCLHLSAVASSDTTNTLDTVTNWANPGSHKLIEWADRGFYCGIAVAVDTEETAGEFDQATVATKIGAAPSINATVALNPAVPPMPRGGSKADVDITADGAGIKYASGGAGSECYKYCSRRW